MNENERIARGVLASTKEAQAPDLDTKLIEQIYDIEIKHQFSRERTVAAELIRNLVDQYVQNDGQFLEDSNETH